MKKKFRLPTIIGAAALLSACGTDVQIVHSPLIAKSNEQITFTANAITDSTPEDLEIEIFVNNSLVQTCTTSPCIYTGGPYASSEDDFIIYHANVTADYDILGFNSTQTDTDGYFWTGITDSNYDWNGDDVLYGRWHGSTSTQEDLIFHMADDYAANGEDFEDFVDDATDKVEDIFGQQDIIEKNMEKINFWVYKNEGDASGCGTVHADAATDVPWADDDAVLHTTNFQDCTNAGLSHFSAEGFNTKAFLHEAGHAIFGLGDEYDGPTNYSIVQSPEPNIFDTENECRDEQTLKSRDPDDCFEFTSRDGGWWGTHVGTSVMTQGNVGNPWQTEASERVNKVFDDLLF